MINNLNEAVIDRIVAACNGDLRGAVKALLLVNEYVKYLGALARPLIEWSRPATIGTPEKAARAETPQ